MTRLGNCFDTAAHIVAFDDPDDSLVLVHGEVWHKETGWHWHAWVEQVQSVTHPDWPTPIAFVNCIDRSNGNDVTIPRELYYHYSHATNIVRYDRSEARKHLLGSKNYGPWHDHTMGDGT